MAAAPAALTATATAPMATDSEAADVSALMVAPSMASTVMAPSASVVFTVASVMKAETLLSISLYAPANPIDTATPTPPNPAARLAAPVSAVILEVSCAFIVTLPASISVARVPNIESLSMNELTSTLTVLIATAPAPLTLTPTAPPEAAAEPATTRASRD